MATLAAQFAPWNSFDPEANGPATPLFFLLVDLFDILRLLGG
jgi:hypothetical protein